MNNEQYLDIVAAILAASEHSEEKAMSKYLKLKQSLIDKAKQEQKKHKLKVNDL